MRVTLDTSALGDLGLRRLADALGWDIRVTSVSQRETEGSGFQSDCLGYRQIAEAVVWDDSSWDNGVWPSSGDANCLEAVLAVIGSGSFPGKSKRVDLSRGHRHQLRDALAFCAHVREGRDIFVTCDTKAFVTGGRRGTLEGVFSTRILTPPECIDEFGNDVN